MIGRAAGFRAAPRAVNARRRRGTVVIVVLVVIVLLTYACYHFVDRAEIESIGAANRAEMARLLTCIDSGEDFVRAFLEVPPAERSRFGNLTDDRNLFQGRLVYASEHADEQARFTILAPRLGERGVEGLRFGLTNESTKLSLAALLEWEKRVPGAAQAALLKLPGMTTRVADSILDWIDPDSARREEGAEEDDYAVGSGAARPANAPPRSLSELLAVRGVRRMDLFGADQNANFQVSAQEQHAAEFEPAADASASSSSGDASAADQIPWFHYLTPYSAEANTSVDGRPRINVNDPDLRRLRGQLAQRLPSAWAPFVIAYRQFGPASASAAAAGPVVSDLEIDVNAPAKFQIASIHDLIGSSVLVLNAAGESRGVLKSPISTEPESLSRDLLRFADLVTPSPAPFLTGRVNINEAPRAVLLAVPGIDKDLAAAILEQRGSLEQPAPHDAHHEAWLVTEGLVSLEQMKSLDPFITTRGAVFRGQIVGFFDEGTLSARSEFVVDGAVSPPRTLFRRDLRRFGRGYSLDVLRGARVSSIEGDSDSFDEPTDAGDEFNSYP